MGNENLKNALKDAGLSAEQFAEVIRVDPKSVARWVTGNTIPYPKHRAAISQALNLTEHQLWPNETTGGQALGENNAGGEDRGAGCDVTGTWAYADDHGAPDLVAFITETTGPIDVIDSCCGVEISGEVPDALQKQAEKGRKVRILTDGSAPHWEPLLAHPGIDLYLAEIPGEYWLIKTLERMLLTINLEHQPGTEPGSPPPPPPPMLELTATTAGGLVDRLAGRFEELWELTNETEPAQADGPPPGSPARREDHPTTGTGPDVGRRRWPRQPD